jgi:hypothetical protein
MVRRWWQVSRYPAALMAAGAMITTLLGGCTVATSVLVFHEGQWATSWPLMIFLGWLPTGSGIYLLVAGVTTHLREMRASNDER